MSPVTIVNRMAITMPIITERFNVILDVNFVLLSTLENFDWFFSEEKLSWPTQIFTSLIVKGSAETERSMEWPESPIDRREDLFCAVKIVFPAASLPLPLTLVPAWPRAQNIQRVDFKYLPPTDDGNLMAFVHAVEFQFFFCLSDKLKCS